MILWADLEILARTVYGEARGEPFDGMRAVAHVMLNRWKCDTGQFRKDDTIATACLRHVQFSTWNASDPNFTVLQNVTLDSERFRICVAAAIQAFDAADPTQGSLHYHTKVISPSWAKGHTPVYEIGHHVFYNDVD